jgi:hypothetical protein
MLMGFGGCHLSFDYDFVGTSQTISREQFSGDSVPRTIEPTILSR